MKLRSATRTNDLILPSFVRFLPIETMKLRIRLCHRSQRGRNHARPNLFTHQCLIGIVQLVSEKCKHKRHSKENCTNNVIINNRVVPNRNWNFICKQTTTMTHFPRTALYADKRGFDLNAKTISQ